MGFKRKKGEKLAFINTNTAWVVSELETLMQEWEDWAAYVPTIEDHPYDSNTHSEVYADGVENMDKHDILREKTLTFLDNNIQGHNFMCSNEYEEPFERRDLRLSIKVPHRIKELRILMAQLDYANVPEGYWNNAAKSALEKIKEKSPDVAIKLLEKILRNPTGLF